MSGRHRDIFYIIWRLIAFSFVILAAQEPPTLSSDYQNVVFANVMERAQLSCPIRQAAGDTSGLFYSWTKDNESIAMAWVRFETKGANLIIDDVDSEDSGTYVCIATNGFGSQRAGIQLIVRDPMTESTTLDENGEFQNSNDLLIEGLSFTEETERQPRQVRITVGSSFDIQCGVAGYPYPDLIWLKDGEVYQRSQRNQPESETGWTTSRFTLSVRKAASGTSGNYTCLAMGLKEKIQTTFTIRVLGPSLPGMSEVAPSNVTELRGGRAKFHCWVHSSSEPEVEWLKRLPNSASARKDLTLHINTSLVVGEAQFQRLDSDELVPKYDGSYLKTLQLDPLSEKDAGLYLCLGSNRYGYNIEKTYLNVKPNYETFKDSKSVPLSTMVALPSVLVLSVAAGFVCWVREREKQRRQAALAALDTGWSHAYIADEEQQQQQQQQQQQAMETVVESGYHRGSSGGHATYHSRQTLTSGAGCHHLNEEADADLVLVKRADAVDRRAAVHQSGNADLQPNYYFQRHRRHQLNQQRNTSSPLII